MLQWQRELPLVSVTVKVFAGLERWRPLQGNNGPLLGGLGGYPADIDRPVDELNGAPNTESCFLEKGKPKEESVKRAVYGRSRTTFTVA